MQIEIVTIGNEILSGRTLDTNFVFMARALEAVGVQVGWHTVVPDHADRIAEALGRALERADAVVMTGGLGPTPDDLTRKAVATALGRPLRLEEAVLEDMRERARRMNRTLPASAESQALIPLGSELWKNPVGVAPGILLHQRERPIVLLPGVPSEAEALVRDFLVPFLGARTGRAVESFTLRTMGVYETLLQEKIAQLPQGWHGGSLAYLPSSFGVDLRVTVVGDNAEAVRSVTERAYDELKARVEPVLYAEGTRGMEQELGDALVARGWKIAVAESCTGGLVAKRITDAPGASRYFERGFVTYSNQAKVDLLGVRAEDLAAHGAVSDAVAAQMAAGARTQTGAEVGIGVTGIAGPDGGTPAKPVGTVYIAVAAPSGAGGRMFRMLGTRATIRERAAQTALDLARRQVLGLSLEPRLA